MASRQCVECYFSIRVSVVLHSSDDLTSGSGCFGDMSWPLRPAAWIFVEFCLCIAVVWNRTAVEANKPTRLAINISTPDHRSGFSFLAAANPVLKRSPLHPGDPTLLSVRAGLPEKTGFKINHIILPRQKEVLSLFRSPRSGDIRSWIS